MGKQAKKTQGQPAPVPKVVSVKVVSPWESHAISGKLPRCCAAGCGDKIKDDQCAELTYDDATVSYLERDCVEHYVKGHPDYAGAHGLVEHADASMWRKDGRDFAGLASATSKRAVLRKLMTDCPACVPEEADAIQDDKLDEWIRSHVRDSRTRYQTDRMS